MSLRTCALGAIMVILIPWSSMAADLTPRQLKKNLKQAGRSWEAGQVERAIELYENVLNATSPGASERPDALYAISVMTLTPDSKQHDPARAKTLLTELASSFPEHDRRHETRALLSSLENRDAEVEKATAEAEQRALILRAEQKAQMEERQEIEAQIVTLEAELKQANEQLAAARKNRQGAKCRAIEQELEKAKKAIQKLAEECSGGFSS